MLSGSAPFSLTRREKERRAEWAARVEEAGSMIIGLLRQRQSNPVKHPRCAIAAIKVEVQLQGMTNRCVSLEVGCSGAARRSPTNPSQSNGDAQAAGD
jgi:hypothetical protein